MLSLVGEENFDDFDDSTDYNIDAKASPFSRLFLQTANLEVSFYLLIFIENKRLLIKVNYSKIFDRNWVHKIRFKIFVFKYLKFKIFLKTLYTRIEYDFCFCVKNISNEMLMKYF